MSEIAHTFRAETAEELNEIMAEALRERGYRVEQVASREEALLRKLGPGEVPVDFCRRIGIRPNSFCRLMTRSHRPQIAVERGAAGRLLFIWPTAEFEAWVRSRMRSPAVP